jgi:hypothetical protein
MSITQYSLTSSAWTVITTAGQSGTCWLDPDNDGAGGAVDVRLYHSATGVPALSKDTEGFPVYAPSGNREQLPFTADSGGDIYYAKCKTSGSTAIISVDAS